MGGGLSSITNGRLGIVLALAVGQSIPPRFGYPLARFLALRMASLRNTSQVQAARANLRVIRQDQISEEDLDQAVRATFCHTARCLYDLYHCLNNPESIKRSVRLSPAMKALIQRSREGASPFILTFLHMSQFDFAGRAIGLMGLKAQILTYSDPNSHYQWQNENRRKFGLEITPISTDTLRTAVHRLERGGAIMTALDRPLPDSKYRPRFFGRPAALPTLHIRLALKTNAPVYVGASLMQPDGIYEIMVSGPIPIEPHSNSQTEIIQNAETVLGVAADIIRQAPHQWAMFYPVWPERQDTRHE